MNKEHLHLFETNNFTLPVGPATILAVSNNIQTGDFHTSKSTLSKTCFPEMRQVSQPPWSRHPYFVSKTPNLLCNELAPPCSMSCETNLLASVEGPVTWPCRRCRSHTARLRWLKTCPTDVLRWSEMFSFIPPFQAYGCKRIPPSVLFCQRAEKGQVPSSSFHWDRDRGSFKRWSIYLWMAIGENS